MSAIVAAIPANLAALIGEVFQPSSDQMKVFGDRIQADKELMKLLRIKVAGNRRRGGNPFIIYKGEMAADIKAALNADRPELKGRELQNEITKMAGEMWRALTDAQKAPYQAMFQQRKEESDDEKPEKKKRVSKKAAAQAAQAKPKRVPNTYIIFKTEKSAEIKEEILKERPELKGRELQNEITKVAGAMWKALSDEEKAPFEQMRAERVEAADGAKAAPAPKAAKAPKVAKAKSGYARFKEMHLDEFKETLLAENPELKGRALNSAVAEYAKQQWKELSKEQKATYEQAPDEASESEADDESVAGNETEDDASDDEDDGLEFDEAIGYWVHREFGMCYKNRDDEQPCGTRINGKFRPKRKLPAWGKKKQ